MRRYIVIVAALLACGGPEEDIDTKQDSLSTPSCTVESPRADEIVPVADEKNQRILIAFTVRDFVLRESGECRGRAGCGHVHVGIDGGRCGESAATASPAAVSVSRCEAKDADRDLVVELHDDDCNVVKNKRGNDVRTVIKIRIVVDDMKSKHKHDKDDDDRCHHGDDDDECKCDDDDDDDDDD